MNGMIVGANGKFLVEQKDIMVLVKKIWFEKSNRRKYVQCCIKEANDVFSNSYTRR